MKFNNLTKINIKDYDLVVVGVDKNNKVSYKDKQVQMAFDFIVDNKSFKFEKGSIKSIPVIGENIIYTYIFLDEEDINDATKVTALFNKLYKSINKENPNKVAITFYDMIPDFTMDLLVQSFIMSEYKFDKYLSNKTSKRELLVDIMSEKVVDIRSNVNKASATNFAKDLVNEPACGLTPEILAQKTIEELEGTNVKIDVLGKEDIEKLDMKAFLSVARGSRNEPKFIIMTYMGNPNSDKITGLVGKGITFDSGGFSLKTKNGIVNMKNDMAGSAAVIGAMKIIAENKINANVIAVVAACENILSKDAYLPGDVIGSMAGKTIEIRSTDAEGRLTLADALTYIIRDKKVHRVIDIATLTGSATTIFGKYYTPYISTDEEVVNAIEKASITSGERIWRLPMIDEVNEKIKSKIADLKNADYNGAPGMIGAGMFLAKFNEDIPWTHIDIAGKGLIDNLATGFGARLLAEMVENLYKKQI